ncbi:hypothetical protein SAMN04488063_2387 [Halopelagius inordinatus]|uniref:SHOCT domain-containing protein n=1 Tax=Halopelagius inordinatus TaxID=553467 RepID=A0A1I2SQU0_9EURY|nr:SHOCT domain-containing protein [Halopelagius inordinatus]SFG55100.1 hypothetical protein SAMN04488063_2387 [Halopelagius inordinatus]
MGILRDRLFGLSVVVFLLSATLSVVVLGYGALVLASAFVTDASVVGALFELAVPWVALAAVSLLGTVFGSVGAVYALARRVSVPRGGRLHRLAAYAERACPPLRTLGLSEALSEPEPSPEEKAQDALEDLKRRYVAGEMDEREFERRVDRLVANDSVDGARAERKRREVLRDESRGR